MYICIYKNYIYYIYKMQPQEVVEVVEVVTAKKLLRITTDSKLHF